MSLTEYIKRVDVVNSAAVVAIVLFVYIVYRSLNVAAQAEDPISATRDVVIWALPVILNILATYGIIKERSN